MAMALGSNKHSIELAEEQEMHKDPGGPPTVLLCHPPSVPFQSFFSVPMAGTMAMGH